jgi:hypothetical protein
MNYEHEGSLFVNSFSVAGTKHIDLLLQSRYHTTVFAVFGDHRGINGQRNVPEVPSSIAAGPRFLCPSCEIFDIP